MSLGLLTTRRGARAPRRCSTSATTGSCTGRSSTRGAGSSTGGRHRRRLGRRRGDRGRAAGARARRALAGRLPVRLGAPPGARPPTRTGWAARAERGRRQRDRPPRLPGRRRARSTIARGGAGCSTSGASSTARVWPPRSARSRALTGRRHARHRRPDRARVRTASSTRCIDECGVRERVRVARATCRARSCVRATARPTRSSSRRSGRSRSASCRSRRWRATCPSSRRAPAGRRSSWSTATTACCSNRATLPSLAAAITRVADDAALRRRLVAGGRETASWASVDDLADVVTRVAPLRGRWLRRDAATRSAAAAASLIARVLCQPVAMATAGFELHGEATPIRELLRDLWRSRGLLRMLARKEFFVRYRRASLRRAVGRGAAAVPGERARARVLASRARRHRDAVRRVRVPGVRGVELLRLDASRSRRARSSTTRTCRNKIYFPRAVLPLTNVAREPLQLRVHARGAVRREHRLRRLPGPRGSSCSSRASRCSCCSRPGCRSCSARCTSTSATCASSSRPR